MSVMLVFGFLSLGFYEVNCDAVEVVATGLVQYEFVAVLLNQSRGAFEEVG
jgi:hypothetical protein